jgi:hypothetical protein
MTIAVSQEWMLQARTGCSIRTAALDHLAGEATSSRWCPEVPALAPKARDPAQMTLPPS